MKINLIAIFLITCFLNCKPGTQEKKASFVHSILDSLKIDKSRNILIYTINPNDCVNCLFGFVTINNAMASARNSKIYVLSVNREIEKKKFLESFKNINLENATNKVVLWDKDIYMGINGSVSSKMAIPLSSLTIYNYQKDSVIFAKPIHELTSMEEFSDYVAK